MEGAKTESDLDASPSPAEPLKGTGSNPAMADKSDFGVKRFHTFLMANDQLVKGQHKCHVNVNLLQLSDHPASPKAEMPLGWQPRPGSGCLLWDAQSCIHKLYGGYNLDWVSGGQWSQMIDFLAMIGNICQQNNVQVKVFMNGSLEPERFDSWRQEQLAKKNKIRQVFQHLDKKGTWPSSHFWVTPTGFLTTLRLALKNTPLGLGCSLEDHRKELMVLSAEPGCNGVISDDPEIGLFQPPRFLSIREMKMTGSNGLSTTEIVMDEVAKALDLNPNRFCMLAVLLGNHILTGEDLRDFHRNSTPLLKDTKPLVHGEKLILAVVKYIRSVPKIDDMERVSEDIFGDKNDPRKSKLTASFAYYSSTFTGGSNPQKPKAKAHVKVKKHIPIVLPGRRQSGPSLEDKKKTQLENDLVERIALEFDQLDINDAFAGATVISAPAGDQSDEKGRLRTNISTVEAVALGLDVKPAEDGKYPTQREGVEAQCDVQDIRSNDFEIKIPSVHPEVLQTVVERHRVGNMSPQLYQLLTKGEIKFEAILESPLNEALPIHAIFSSMRCNLYAILFNLNHTKFQRRQFYDIMAEKRKKADAFRTQAKKATEPEAKAELLAKALKLEDQNKASGSPPSTEIRVREWLPYNDYVIPAMAMAAELRWSVPTLQRLWFGANPEEKQRRLRAFFSCMRSDDSPPLVHRANVPQHLLLMACVLRYIMSIGAILKKPELDALVLTAFSPELSNPHFLASLQGGMMTPRGIHIASIFLQGVENAILVNEGCGAPIPMNMCLPWTFFDGALFQLNLRKASMSQNIFELCEGRMDLVGCVERMRVAIVFGMPMYGGVPMGGPLKPPPIYPGSRGPRAPPQNGFGQPLMEPRIPRGGGHLVVGGSVVANWGDNPGPRGQPRTGYAHHPPTNNKKKIRLHNKKLQICRARKGEKSPRSGGVTWLESKLLSSDCIQVRVGPF
eukprot:maker-scaffold195_size270011-snap-gene-1.20 protein:Tk11331 transcript:maker-scaffold195_size270011-snap-gene-1.20-mRNA-1 annotation:"constitutive coactivator of ppar-gamma-like protein 1-like protein"